MWIKLTLHLNSTLSYLFEAVSFDIFSQKFLH